MKLPVTQVIPEHEAELQRGFRYRPGFSFATIGKSLFAVASIVSIIVGVFGGAAAAIFTFSSILLFLVGMAIVLGPPVVISYYAIHRIYTLATRKPVRARPLLKDSESKSTSADAMIVSYDGQPKIAIALASFVPARQDDDAWLENWPVDFGGAITAIQTTGGPVTHATQETEQAVHRFVLFDLDETKGATEFDTTVARILQTFEALGLEPIALDPIVLAIAGSHEWCGAHYYSKPVRLGQPLYKLFTELETRENHTAVLSVSGNEKEVFVSFDIFMYFRADKMPLLVEALPRKYGVELHREFKLPFAAALTDTPLRKLTRFERVR